MASLAVLVSDDYRRNTIKGALVVGEEHNGVDVAGQSFIVDERLSGSDSPSRNERSVARTVRTPPPRTARFGLAWTTAKAACTVMCSRRTTS
jgi:hypothetical protein